MEEWCTVPHEYQNFVGDSCDVKEEAQKFMNRGYFFGPLGDTMVLAVANALGIQVIIFSSAHHYPLIYITPRVCKTSIPLYVAFNQGGPGHYDAVIASTCGPTPSPPMTHTPSRRCTCGHNLKHYSTTKKCTAIEKRYTSIVLCPCLARAFVKTATTPMVRSLQSLLDQSSVRDTSTLGNNIKFKKVHSMHWKLKRI